MDWIHTDKPDIELNVMHDNKTNTLNTYTALHSYNCYMYTLQSTVNNIARNEYD